ncbi:MAG TPA: thiolase family protein [Solirubrobacteraceae bacterium]|nr:thiolase family protein [Solirubrobacteraceae bacterium]
MSFPVQSTPRFPSDIAIAGVGATRQAKHLEETTLSACLQAARAALADAGIDKSQVDGVAGRWPGPGGTVLEPGSLDWATLLGIPVRWVDDSYPQGVPGALAAAAAVSAGLCDTVLILGGQAGGLGTAGNPVATYTRPENEFVAPYGSFTAAQFALVAQVYAHRHRPAPEGMAQIAATIRNMGHFNPDAVMAGRGPYTARDVLDSPLVAEPLHLLELCLANEGAVALVVTTLERARAGPKAPIRLLGGGAEWRRQQYVEPPRYDEVWALGTDAARRMWAQSGLRPSDVDVAQLYDANSWEVIRQLEAFGFCREGEGLDYALEIGLGLDGALPTNTDGGLLSFSALGWAGTSLKIVEAVRQLRGEGGDRQVGGAEVAIASGAGSGAQYSNVLLLGRDR